MQIADWVEAVVFGNVFGGEVANRFGGLFGGVGFNKDKIIFVIELAQALKRFAGMGFACADGMGGANDAAGFALPKDGVEAGDAGGGSGHEVAEDIAGTDGGKLVGITDKQEVCGRGDGLKEVCGEAGIKHARFVNDEKIAGEGVVRVVGKATASAVVFEESVNSGGRGSGGFGESLGGASGGGSKCDAGTFGAEDIDNGAKDGGFAGTGAAGDDGEFGLQGLAEGGGLLGGEVESSFFLCPFEGGFKFDRWDSGLGLVDAVNGLGNAFFGAGEAGPLAGGPEEFLFFVEG